MKTGFYIYTYIVYIVYIITLNLYLNSNKWKESDERNYWYILK